MGGWVWVDGWVGVGTSGVWRLRWVPGVGAGCGCMGSREESQQSCWLHLAWFNQMPSRTKSPGPHGSACEQSIAGHGSAWEQSIAGHGSTWEESLAAHGKEAWQSMQRKAGMHEKQC
eukprot:184596-Chlamydomonas_euryale.AAC.2